MWGYVSDVLYWLPSALLAIPTLLLIFIAVGLSYGFFRQSLSSWSWRHIFSLTRMSFREKQLLASMQAEELVEAALRSAGWKHVFLRRRVPVQRLGHNREIDVVAVGPVVLVVEVKHWRGSVWSNGPRWFQRASDSRRALEFEDIQEDNLVKAAALRRFIENDRRIPLSDYHTVADSLRSAKGDKVSAAQGYGTWYTDRRVHKQCGELVVPVVVFTNPAVKLDPSTVKLKKCVFDLPAFEAYARKLMRDMRSPSTFRSPWGSFVRFLKRVFFRSMTTTSSALSPEEEERVASEIEKIRTWDMIYLHNGRLLHGDVRELDLPSMQCRFERKHLLDVEIRWFDGILGFVRSLWEGGGGLVRVRLAAAQRVAMRRSEIAFPIARRNIRRIGCNDRVIVKLAGTLTIETVPLADIRTIRFSHHMEESHK
ncbi:hypothetical protein DQ04_00141030 [Trypanosoma grayi]|uniref:hypothetical protein n=1 Tax=Trypanosoma grayi TaxID=71804 RepID=UPI0004F3FE8C|nr:hypothetical protein DQ04_00141030 [Trypanosoma grayi]KEG15215.1 hypothetical protein DQ04_00141030 [Trypanosoma grayi]